MTKLLKILALIILFTKIANSYELISNSHLKVALKTYALPDGSKFSIYQGEGTWTDNYGNYGTNTCRGVVKTDDLNKIDLEIMCEGSDKNDYKNWSMTKRVSDNFEQGVGVNEYIEGTGVWKRLKGLKCTYATSYKNNVSFTLEKCKISEEQHKFLSSNE